MSLRYYHTDGYTFFGLLFAIMLIGLALTGAATVWQVQQQRYKEQQLLLVGNQYSAAIASYYRASPGGVRQYPRKLGELLRDPRYPVVKRHIRKLWRDPLTLSDNWGLVLDAQGGIAGVYSHAPGKPLMQVDLVYREPGSQPREVQSYAEWKFIHPEGLSAEILAEIHSNQRDKLP